MAWVLVVRAQLRMVTKWLKHSKEVSLPHLRLTADHVVKMMQELGDDFVPLLLSVTFHSYDEFALACARNVALVGVVEKIYHFKLGNIERDLFSGSLYDRKQAVFD